ncbi:glycosyltransferase family 2 protein [Ensifer soli]|uniref:glycosyltransferase family 2 protein n=1 Tax=Ciceribacter sp. sgz301302 TaxID=3342379 RepID=UPI0035BAD43F
MKKYKVSAVACARWEADYISEWVAYYKDLGVDHIYIYSNDEDESSLRSALLPFIGGPDGGYVTYHHFPYQGQQRSMYCHYLENYAHETEWCAFIDIDEFLNLRGRTIVDFLDRFPYADAVYFNWLNFGNNGFLERPRGCVLENYTRREAGVHHYTKNIFRPSRIDVGVVTSAAHRNSHFWHGWHMFSEFRMRVVNVVGDSMDDYYVNFPEKAIGYVNGPRGRDILETAVIHHYSMKSLTDYRRRVERGTFGDFAGQKVWGSFSDQEIQSQAAQFNAVEDRSLARHWLSKIGYAIACVPEASGRSVAELGTARASSVSPWSHSQVADEDANRALAGAVSGDYSFHTALEDDPWWRVDLGSAYPLSEVWVFNRINGGDQAPSRHLKVSVSLDDSSYVDVYKADGRPFGGADGHPLIVRLEGARRARYVRLSIEGRACLHLDKVRIYAATGTG